MSDTPTSRGYAWGLQVDYATQKALSAGSQKEIVCLDQNFMDYSPATQNDEDWSHGSNSATDEWIETHSNSIQHTMPAFSQQLGELLYINLGQYAITTPSGGTASKQHAFKPTDPSVTRQDKAVTYTEKTGSGWNILSKSMVGDGFSLKGSGMGVLTADFGLVGSGHINPSPGTTWYPTSSANVARRTGQHKLFNSQIGLVTVDSGGTTTYGCRYRSFQFNYKKTMLDAASLSPGCANFLTSGDPTSGALRSSYEFDKQMLDFTLEVDMAAGSPELVAVQQQKAEAITLTATGGIIESTVHHALTMTIPIGKYQTSKPVVADGMMRFSITGKALFDFSTGKLFEIDLVNDIATYASAF